jgi:ABC-2 type transport system ATP-binding protein
MSVLKTKNLTKYYGKERGIVDVSISIEKGEIFGFIGPNGAGKSTTIRTILGLLKASGGSIELFEQDATLKGPQLREKIGYLPSEVYYYDNLKAKELLMYSASFYPIKKTAALAKMQNLADKLQLDLNKKIDSLSFGNKKKVGVIQSLIHSPELIILDEPTSGLDPLMQQQFYEILKEENDRGASIMLSSHNLPEIQKMSDRVGIIREGKIIKVDTVDKLIGNNYKKVNLELQKPNQKLPSNSQKGITNVETKDNLNCSFMWNGPINDLNKLLATLDLKNLSIEEPDLEEVFLHYYKEDR